VNLDVVVSELGLTEAADTLARQWEQSQECLPAGDIPFLDPDSVAQACRDLGLSEEATQAALGVCARARGSPALEALAWHFHYCLFRAAKYRHEWIEDWPSFQGVLDQNAGMFYVVVLLSRLPKLQEENRTRGVPEEVARDTLRDLARSIEHHRHHGARALGLRSHEVAWFANFVRGDLYRLGRLQFQFSSFYLEVRAFRHRPSGAVLALSDEGVRYQSNGQLAGGDGEGRADDTWTARLLIGEEEIVGFPILPTGRALPREARLPASEWTQVLGRRDPTLNVHMPDGGPLGHAACGESFRRALEFFPRHFPDRPFRGFCCTSWLLDGQLESWLPLTSNMVRFQREVYLVPIGMDTDDLVRTVFHGRLQDLAKAPRDTTLQRAIVDHLLAGGRLEPTAGGCFLLREDFDWGGEVYRRQDLARFIGSVSSG